MSVTFKSPLSAHHHFRSVHRRYGNWRSILRDPVKSIANFMLFSFLAAMLAAAFGLAGCSWVSSPRYFINMVNRTPHNFDGVAVYFDGKMAAEAGHLVKGGLASYGYVTLPIPAEAEVRWDDRGGASLAIGQTSRECL